jgi:hypothetical protein
MTYFKPGDNNAVCFECGMKFKASELKKHWQGYYVCEKHWEPRHPQDYVRAVKENPSPPWSQPVPQAVFTAFCTPQDSSAVPRQALPGCVRPGFVSPFFDFSTTSPD